MMPNDTLGSPGSASSPSNQFQQFFNPHMNADVSPGTKKQQQDAALDSLIGELDTSYIDIPGLISHTETGKATDDDAMKEKE